MRLTTARQRMRMRRRRRRMGRMMRTAQMMKVRPAAAGLARLLLARLLLARLLLARLLVAPPGAPLGAGQQAGD
jgi:hypothetical protein